MFGLFRRKKQGPTADTFVEATGGGWSDAPDFVDASNHDDFVADFLRRAHDYALQNEVKIGEEFQFTITHIPFGITSPHEIILPVMVRASEFGLSPVSMMGETAYFIRVT